MNAGLTKLLLLVALFMLAFATWLNDIAIADAMLIFAAFSIGGVWSKYSAAAESETAIEGKLAQS